MDLIQFFVEWHLLVIASLCSCSSCDNALTPARTRQCPGQPKILNCFDSISAIQKLGGYLNSGDVESGSEVNEVSGWTSILRSFENTHFLVILTEFQGSQFSELSYPIILRKLRLAWLWWCSGIENKWEEPNISLYVQHEILERQVNVTRNSPCIQPISSQF